MIPSGDALWKSLISPKMLVGLFNLWIWLILWIKKVIKGLDGGRQPKVGAIAPAMA